MLGLTPSLMGGQTKGLTYMYEEKASVCVGGGLVSLRFSLTENCGKQTRECLMEPRGQGIRLEATVICGREEDRQRAGLDLFAITQSTSLEEQ